MRVPSAACSSRTSPRFPSRVAQRAPHTSSTTTGALVGSGFPGTRAALMAALPAAGLRGTWPQIARGPPGMVDDLDQLCCDLWELVMKGLARLRARSACGGSPAGTLTATPSLAGALAGLASILGATLGFPAPPQAHLVRVGQKIVRGPPRVVDDLNQFGGQSRVHFREGLAGAGSAVSRPGSFPAALPATTAGKGSNVEWHFPLVAAARRQTPPGTQVVASWRHLVESPTGIGPVLNKLPLQVRSCIER